MIRKFLFLPPVLLGLVVLVYLATNREPPERNPPTERSEHVRVVAMQPTVLVPRVIGYGAVTPAKVWNAIAQVSGEVVFVHPDLKKGALLKAGTEIIRISPINFELAIAQVEANIRAADAKLEELRVREENTGLTLEIEQRALDIRDQELARKQDLFKRGTLAQASIDADTRGVLTQRQKVLDLQNSLRLIPSQRAVQVEQKAVYLAQLESARLDLERTHIALPFDARIAEANVEATQFVQVGKTLAIADSVDVAEIEAQIPISRFATLARSAASGIDTVGITSETFAAVAKGGGLGVIVRQEIGGETIEWAGRFSRMSDTIDLKTRTIGIIVAVDDAYAKAIPGERPPLGKGLFVEIELRGKPLADQLLVPRAAIHEDRIYVANSAGRLEIRQIETGLYQGDIVSIRSGLEAGERVVVSDLSPAIEGMLLKTTLDTDLVERIRDTASAAGRLQ